MTTVNATPATIQNSQSGKYAPSTLIDGAYAHPDIRTEAIKAMPIARFEHLPPASGMCRFKVVPVVGINVTPCCYADALLPQVSDFWKAGGTASEVLLNASGSSNNTSLSKGFLNKPTATLSSSSPRSAHREIADIPMRHNNAERSIPHYMNMQCRRKKKRCITGR
jgi:hypothetical protein